MGFKDYRRTWAIIISLFVLAVASFFISNSTDDMNLIVLTLIAFALLVISIVYGIALYFADKLIENSLEKQKTRKYIYTTIFILACIGFLIVFYYYALKLPDSVNFIREGITAGITAIIGGLALESILDLKKHKK
jgi:uncharacterized membrane-anchored protein